jgi:hypothetical protein
MKFFLLSMGLLVGNAPLPMCDWTIKDPPWLTRGHGQAWSES